MCASSSVDQINKVFTPCAIFNGFPRTIFTNTSILLNLQGSATLKALVTQVHWLSTINKMTIHNQILHSIYAYLIGVVNLVYLILVLKVLQGVYGSHPDGILWWQTRKKQDRLPCVYF